MPSKTTKTGNLISQIQNYFAQNVDHKYLAITRILFGLSFFLHYANLIGHIDIIFGVNGLFGYNTTSQLTDLLEASRESAKIFKLFRFIQSDSIIYFLFYTLLLSSLSFALGFKTKISGTIALVLHCLFHGHDEFAFWGWAALVKPFTVYLLFTQCQAWLSLDSWLYNKKHNTRMSSHGSIVPVFLLQLHVAMIYVVAGWARFDDPNWIDGSMLYGVLTDPLFSRINSDWREVMGLLKVMCYGAWIVEILAPITLWFKRTRSVSIVLVILFHVSLELLTKVGYWNFVMTGAVLAFSDKNFWQWLKLKKAP